MEVVRTRLLRSSYRDSVQLMGASAQLEGLPGVARAALMMGTPANLALLSSSLLLDSEAEDAKPGDLIVAVAADNEEAAASALVHAVSLLEGEEAFAPTGGERTAPRSLSEALRALPSANLAIISTPGAYATAEALKALKRGLHVFIFSDNVPIADEIELKELAHRKGLLMMGPDCGTAILDGIPLGFANAVRRGRIGIIGASGTGIQQVSCLIDRNGEGISQAIGVGGRDLDERVGAVMMSFALERLSTDPGTAVIVLLAKPASPTVAERVLAAVRGCPKPVVVGFLGGDSRSIREVGAVPAASLEEAAMAAMALALGKPPGGVPFDGESEFSEAVCSQVVLFSPGQRLVRGLYSGGTLAHEARLVLEQVLGTHEAPKHKIVDLGDDQYTVARPHPMIDLRLRSQQIVSAAQDPATAVLLVDVVLGYGAHPDPAGALLPALLEARRRAGQDGRHLAVVASVCGTEADPQGLRQQEETLASGGVLLAPSNAQAAKLAALIAREARPVGRGEPGPGRQAERAPALEGTLVEIEDG